MHSYRDLLSSLAYAHRCGMGASESGGVIYFGSSAPIGKPLADWQATAKLGPTLGLKPVQQADTTCEADQWALLCCLVPDLPRADALWEKMREDPQPVKPVLKTYNLERCHEHSGCQRIDGWCVSVARPVLGVPWMIDYLIPQETQYVSTQRVYLQAASPEEAAEKANAILKAINSIAEG